jgi:hypothetical protein
VILNVVIFRCVGTVLVNKCIRVAIVPIPGAIAFLSVESCFLRNRFLPVTRNVSGWRAGWRRELGADLFRRLLHSDVFGIYISLFAVQGADVIVVISRPGIEELSSSPDLRSMIFLSLVDGPSRR